MADPLTSRDRTKRRAGPNRRFWRAALGVGLAAVAVLTQSGAAVGAFTDSHTRQTDFYQNPSRRQLEATPVGGVLATEPLPVTEAVRKASSRALRIMYRSDGVNGRPVAVTGYLTVPQGRPPAGGWPVIAWAHGTTGVGPECAPSRQPDLGGYESVIARYLRHGYAVVATDYPGLGLPGQLHNFLQKNTLTRSLIDSVVAARHVSPELGRRWFAAGHSEGGLPALGAGEIAARRAPELELLGVVPIAIGGGSTAAWIDSLAALRPPFTQDQRASAVFLAYDAVGAVQAAPGSIRYTDLLSPELAARMPALAQLCLGDAINFLGYTDPPIRRLVNPDWARNQTLLRWLRSNVAAQRHSDAPILLVSGGRDTIARPSTVNQLFGDLCSLGDVVERREYPDSDHVTVVHDAQREIIRWLDARLRGVPAGQGCQPTADVDDLAPERVPGMHGK